MVVGRPPSFALPPPRIPLTVCAAARVAVELRRAARLSQEALARKADVGTDAVRHWEKGRRTPGLNMAVKLADALACSLDELVGRTPPKKRRGK